MWQELTQLIARFPRLASADRTRLLESLHIAGRPEEGPADLLRGLQAALSEPLATREGLETSWNQLVAMLAPALATEDDTDDLIDAVESLGDTYQQLGGEHPLRDLALRAIAAVGTDEAIETLVELLVSDPPGEKQTDLIFATLWQHPRLPVELLFPRLLDVLQNERLTALVLELASEVYRRGLVQRHPAHEQAALLRRLFAALADRLGVVEEQPSTYAQTPDELSRIVERSTGLAMALADALGLIGDPEAVPALRKAFLLTHRRLRAEAAAAIARLGDDEGIKHLAALAADPGIRLRALHYLDELGHTERVPEEFRTPEAQAAGELALRLAHPSLFGLAPSELELVDQRELFWPGFEVAVRCFLFRYQYRHPEGYLQGIGLVGPLTHALKVPPIGLPAIDIYAIYAGWVAEHPELIRTSLIDGVPETLDVEAQRWHHLLEGAGYTQLRAIRHVQLFGQPIWLWWARHESRVGTLVVDDDTLAWYPEGNDAETLAPDQVDFLHVGRKILRAFNPAEALA